MVRHNLFWLCHAGVCTMSGNLSDAEFQLYPTPDGSLAGIRLEQIRDGIEDWECLKLLGRETSPGVWNGLIARAENSAAGLSDFRDFFDLRLNVRLAVFI